MYTPPLSETYTFVKSEDSGLWITYGVDINDAFSPRRPSHILYIGSAGEEGSNRYAQSGYSTHLRKYEDERDPSLIKSTTIDFMTRFPEVEGRIKVYALKNNSSYENLQRFNFNIPPKESSLNSLEERV